MLNLRSRARHQYQTMMEGSTSAAATTTTTTPFKDSPSTCSSPNLLIAACCSSTTNSSSSSSSNSSNNSYSNGNHNAPSCRLQPLQQQLQQQQQQRRKLHYSPLPRTRLFSEPNHNKTIMTTSLWCWRNNNNSNKINKSQQHSLHAPSHQRRGQNWTVSTKLLYGGLMTLMMLSVWTTISMTLVFLCHLEQPFLSFPTIHHYQHSTTTTSVLRRRQQQQPQQQQLSSRSFHPPRVVFYEAEPVPTTTTTESLSSSSSSSSQLLQDLLPPLPLLVVVKNDTTWTQPTLWELPVTGMSSDALESSTLSHHDDAHYYASSSSSSSSQQQHQHGSSECVPMASWQTKSFPNCNVVHEIDLTNVPPSTVATTPASDEEEEEDALQNTTRRYHNNNNIKNFDAMKILGKGWFRITWQYDTHRTATSTTPSTTTDTLLHQPPPPPILPQVHSNDITTTDKIVESVVLKTLRLDRDFSSEFYELHRRDALAMERLTFSPYVMNIYGYCGQSALNELADFNVGGMTRLEELNRRLRGQHQPAVYLTKLQLAYQLAMALYHVHHLPTTTKRRERELLEDDQVMGGETETDSQQRPEPPAVMVHYDVNPRNVALVRGGFAKLNDFNTCEFLQWNPKTGETCAFRGRFHEPWWRSPEEMLITSTTTTNDTSTTTSTTVLEHHDQTATTTTATKMTTTPKLLYETVDIYAMGNVLFHILTTHSPRGKMKASRLATVQEMVSQGQRPLLPAMYQLVVPPPPSSSQQQSPLDTSADYNYTAYYHNYNATTPQEVAIVAFLQAMDGCYPMDPTKRMSARQVARIFKTAIENVKRMMNMNKVMETTSTTTTITIKQKRARRRA